MKVFADENLNVAQMRISVSNTIENIAGNGENAGDEHFFLLSLCCSKALFFRVVKNRDCVAKAEICSMILFKE